MAQEPELQVADDERPAPVVQSTVITYEETTDPNTGEDVLLEHREHVLDTDPPQDVDPEDAPAPVVKPRPYVVQRLSNEEMMAAPIGEHRPYPAPPVEDPEESKPAPQVGVEGQPPAWNAPSADESKVAPVDGVKKVRVPKSDQPAPVAGA